MFKVGWLITHNYETTTILYYTVFLPGVLLHEAVYWLMAGVMNVRADRALTWPQKQEIGNLQLNFVKLAPKAHPIKRAVIAATPLIVGLLAVWIIGVNVFQLETVIAVAGTGNLGDVVNAISVLTSAPDFWLWFYISFTIANTMFPTIPKDMRGWWQIGGAVSVIIIAMLILGIGQSFLGELTLSISQFLNSLSLILVLVIFINIVMVVLLGAIESAIERITGHSATFQKGKMITMTREEVLQLKQQEQEKRLTSRSAPRRRALAVPGSIYGFDFPIPGPPGQEPVTKGVAAVIGMDVAGELDGGEAEDEIIETTATDSTRQRMLKLFPESASKKDESESVGDDDEKALSLPSPRPTTKDIAEQDSKKPDFDIKTFEISSDEIATPSETQIDDDEDLDRTTAKLQPPHRVPSNAGKNDNDTSPKAKQKFDSNILASKDTDEAEDISLSDTPPSPSKIKLSEQDDTGKTTKPDDSKQDEKEATTLPKSSLTQPERLGKSRTAKPSSSIDDSEVDDEDEQLINAETTSSLLNKINLPADESKEVDKDKDEEDKQLPTRPSRKTTDSFKLKAVSEDKEDLPASPFGRPFAKRDEDDNEEVKDNKPVASPTSQFSRPFAKPTSEVDDEEEQLSSKSSTSSWRDQLTSSSAFAKSKDSDKDEDDGQRSVRPARHSSMFDTLNKDKSSKPTFSLDADDDDGDEQLTSASSSSSWRDQLTNSSAFAKSKDGDESDEEDEQLSARPTRSSSIFDSLNKGDASKPAFSEDRDDDEDEQLPRSGSLLSGLGRPQSQPPRANILGRGSRPAPKPTSKPQKSNDTTSSDRKNNIFVDDDDLEYEPIDDDFMYEDDDDFGFYEDDDDYYDDEP